MYSAIRGIRNNNPGNIEKGSPWQGLLPRDQMKLDQLSESRFCVFKEPKWGIRAIARILIHYQDKTLAADGSPIDTVKEIVDRWAPPVENDTDAYVAHVRDQLDLMVGQQIDVHGFRIMRGLVKAIIMHENGVQPYTETQIDAGLILAGIEPPVKSLSKSRTIKGAQAATLGTTLIAINEVIEPLREQITWLSQYSSYAQYAAISITLIGIVAIVWARIDDKRKGLR